MHLELFRRDGLVDGCVVPVHQLVEVAEVVDVYKLRDVVVAELGEEVRGAINDGVIEDVLDSIQRLAVGVVGNWAGGVQGYVSVGKFDVLDVDGLALSLVDGVGDANDDVVVCAALYHLKSTSVLGDTSGMAAKEGGFANRATKHMSLDHHLVTGLERGSRPSGSVVVACSRSTCIFNGSACSVVEFVHPGRKLVCGRWCRGEERQWLSPKSEEVWWLASDRVVATVVCKRNEGQSQGPIRIEVLCGKERSFDGADSDLTSAVGLSVGGAGHLQRGACQLEYPLPHFAAEARVLVADERARERRNADHTRDEEGGGLHSGARLATGEEEDELGKAVSNDETEVETRGRG